MRAPALPALAVLAVLLSTCVARADEIHLKDGTKITGTIVGFENDAFRVETSYGFALILKNKVADISISAPKKVPDPKTKTSAPPASPPSTSLPTAPPSAALVPPVPQSAGSSFAAPPELAPAVVKESPAPLRSVSEANGAPKDRTSGAAALAPASAKSDTGAPKTIAAAAPAPTPPSPPEPPVIRDEIHGNLYSNLTYSFQMYKPPSWDLIPEARKALPDSIAALGTYDQTTLLVIGRERAKDSLESHATATGKTLSGVYENYRLISTTHVTVAGIPAIEQRSRGTADGHDWSVTLLTLLHGNDAFTLLGMTWADSDLIQVQENVIAKSINSLKFAAEKQ